MERTLQKWLLTLLILIVSMLLIAEDTDDFMQLSLEDLLTVDVTTASKKAESASKAPATIYVVTEAMIRERGYRNLKDLLADIPEVEIQSNSQREYQDLYSFRGVFGNEKFIILLDGFRFNAPTGSPHAVGMNYPLHNAKQVEVILGPASALYGADAFGGIVNIISKATQDRVGDVQLEGGDFGTRTAYFNYGKHFEKLELSLSGMGSESNQANLAESYPDAFAWYREQYLANGQMRADSQSNQLLTLPAALQNRDFAMPSKASFFHVGLKSEDFEFGYEGNSESHSSSTGMRPEYALYLDDAQIEVRIESMHGKHTYTSSEGNWSLQSSVWRGSFEMRPDSHFVNYFSGYQPAYKFEKGSNQKFEEQLNYNFNEKTSLVLGASLERISTTPQSGDLPFPINPNEAMSTQGEYYLGTHVSDRDGNDLTVAQEFFHVDYKNQGYYAQVQTQPSEKINLTVGARYDQNTRFGSTFNPRAGMVLSPSDRLTIKLLYGKSFFAPSPYLSYQHYGSFSTLDSQGQTTTDPTQIVGLAGNFWHVPNPNLKPELLSSYEFNLAYYFNKNWGLFLDGFHSKISDRIVNQAELNGSFLGIPVAVVERPVNVGDANSSALTTRLSGLFNFKNSRINLALAHTYADGSLNDGELPYTAQSTIKSQLNWLYRNWNLNLNMLARSKGYHIGTGGGPAYEANPSFNVWNLYGSFKPAFKTSKWQPEFYGRVENLFDKRYYNSSKDGEDSFSATPQDPLRISAGMRLAW